ncbi:hypothetical protein PEP31012_04671 [Pandoraea eparura]|uniref:Uncharacterized protein n=1 Tax=Pandoraea eparura TaxID=2508291 RepID=A0A5E4YPC4_9BURK|nr:hypothetical protein PEP31012_04671 [Pandoraea eparura]
MTGAGFLSEYDLPGRAAISTELASHQRHIGRIIGNTDALVREVELALGAHQHGKLAASLDRLVDVQRAAHDTHLMLGAFECAKGADFTGFNTGQLGRAVNRIGCPAGEAADFEGGAFDDLRLRVTDAHGRLIRKGFQVCIPPRHQLVGVRVSAIGIDIEQIGGSQSSRILRIPDSRQRGELMVEHCQILLRFRGSVLGSGDGGCVRALVDQRIQRESLTARGEFAFAFDISHSGGQLCQRGFVCFIQCGQGAIQTSTAIQIRLGLFNMRHYRLKGREFLCVGSVRFHRISEGGGNIGNFLIIF